MSVGQDNRNPIFILLRCQFWTGEGGQKWKAGRFVTAKQRYGRRVAASSYEANDSDSRFWPVRQKQTNQLF